MKFKPIASRTPMILFVCSLVAPVLVRARIIAPEPRSERGAEFVKFDGVTVLVPAYLESSVIESKIKELCNQLGAGPYRAEIVVVASDEETAMRAERCKEEIPSANLEVRVIQAPARGKAHAINVGVAASTFEAVLVTDANCTIFPAEWPQLLLAELENHSCVSGSKFEVGNREKGFWCFESWLRSETRTLAVVGEFVAFRRNKFSALPVGVQSDDLWLAATVVANGGDVLTVNTIQTQEEQASAKDQWERRVRICTGQLEFMFSSMAAKCWRKTEFQNYFLHKGYRITVGNLAFWWTSARYMRRASVLERILLTAIAVTSVSRYRLGSKSPTLPELVIALQFVPPVAMLRVMRRRLVAAPVGWVKIPR